MNFTAEKVHSGQYKPYGDSFYVWDIKTDSNDRDAVLVYCMKELCKRKVPEESEWLKNIRYGSGEKSDDAGYYFAGYYSLHKTDGGYKFTVCEPFCD